MIQPRLLPPALPLSFLLAVLLAVAGAPARAADPAPVEVEEATLATLQEAMASGRTTSRAIVQAHLDRIARVDAPLRSIVELNPDALSIADGLDRERWDGRVRGPLHGIPVS